MFRHRHDDVLLVLTPMFEYVEGYDDDGDEDDQPDGRQGRRVEIDGGEAAVDGAVRLLLVVARGTVPQAVAPEFGTYTGPQLGATGSGKE